MDSEFQITFEESEKPPVMVEAGAHLSEVLNVTNSTVLFGCRTGICGTCLIEVTGTESSALLPPDEFESESLEMFAPGNAHARLACQLRANTALRIRKIQAK